MRSTVPRGRLVPVALLGLLVLLLGLLPDSPVRAKETAPAIRILEVGWDGQITPGTWAPIRVQVFGSAQDTDALAEVLLENKYQIGPNQTYRIPLGAYAQEVALPAQSSKEVTIWVPTQHGIMGTVRLTAGGKELGKEEFEFRASKAPIWPLVGVLSDEEGLTAQLRRIELPLQNLPTAINVAQLKPEALPTAPDRYKALRAMVVRGNAPSKLTDAQRAAILGWVRAGGHLLLAGGPDSALSAAVLPAGSLPVTFGGAETRVDLKPLLAWGGPESQALSPNSEGPAVRLAASGGTVLAGTAERPLAWRKAEGAGTITLLAVDPTLEPLASWDGTIPLLKRALGVAFEPELQGGDEKIRMMNMEQEMVYRLRNVIESLPAGAYPGWQMVALYLGGFALLAGPLLHLLLWRKQRRAWLWLAVPAASLLVAGGLYLGGIGLGGRDLLSHTLSYVRIDPQSQTATQMLMVGLYAPMHQELSLTVAGDTPFTALGLLEGPRFGPFGLPEQAAAAKPPFRVVTGRETRIEYNGNEGAMRPIALTRSLGGQTGRITSRITLEGTVLKGTVKNETPYHLEDAAVVVGAKAVKLGAMAPGESREVTLEPAANASQPGHYISFPQIFYGVPVSPEVRARMGQLPPGAPEPMEVPQKPEILRRSRMLESLLYRPKAGPDSVSLPLTFVAFTTERVGEKVLELKDHPSHHLHLIEQPLQIELPNGPFTLPASLIPSDMAMNNIRGMGSSSNGTFTWLEIDSGSVAYTFSPPLPMGTPITALVINTQLIGPPQASNGMGKGMPMPANPTPQAAEAGIFQIWNWGAAAWENLPGNQETVRLTNPAAYLGPENQVRVQVLSGGERVIRFVAPSLSLEGRGGR